jgi:hypothetical protein
MATTTRQRFTSPRTLLRVSLWSILLAAVTYTSADPDLWGHVRFGLDILRSASIPHLDPYSFSADRAWINHEWAAEVITAAAFRAGGDAGLILLKLSAVIAMLLLLDTALRREGAEAFIARDAIAAVAIIATMEQAHHVRPQLFSLLCFATLLSCLMAAGRGNRRWLLAVPLLFAAWANLHGGWMVGGAVLAVWGGARALTGSRLDAVWYLLAAVSALGATLITPYGLELWRFLRDTVGLGRADIVEWQPVYALGWDAWVRWSAVLAVGVLGVSATRRADIRVERIAVVGMVALASFMVARLLAFFALAVLFLFGAALARAYQRRLAARPAAPPAARHAVADIGLAAIAVAISGAAAIVIALNVAHLHIDPRFTPEPGAIAFLNAQPRTGRVLVWFDWGEYAIWHLSPAMRVSIDGRRETVYSAGLQDRHLRFYFDAPGGAALPGELGADYVWIPRTLPAARQLALAHGWHRLYEGDQSVIFGRTGVANPAVPGADVADPGGSLALAAAAPARVFPGP